MTRTWVANQAGGSPGAKPEAVRDWASLMLVFALVGVILLAVVAGVMGARRRQIRRDRRKGRTASLELDAWTEAGRRAKPLPRVSPLDDRGIDEGPSDDEPPASRIREPEP